MIERENFDRYQRFFAVVDRLFETPEISYQQMVKDILEFGYDADKVGPTQDPDALNSLIAALNSRTAKAEAIRDSQGEESND